MSWNPNVASDQSIGLYSLTFKDAEKFVDDAMQKCNQVKVNLNQDDPNKVHRYSFCKIDPASEGEINKKVNRIVNIKENMKELSANLPAATKGFESELRLKIAALNIQIEKIISTSIIYLEQYHHFLEEISVMRD